MMQVTLNEIIVNEITVYLLTVDKMTVDGMTWYPVSARKQNGGERMF
jgi:hypothetical protein